MPIEKLTPTFSLEEERMSALEQIIPEAFADGEINWDTLREALGERLEEEGRDAEHFGLFWHGKRDARRLASIPSKGTLAPAPGEGLNEETTEHVFIEGDNLEVLKLMQKSYAGRVKMIYIDPPYNTGNDLIYKDDYSEPLEDYLRKLGQADEEGTLLTTNTKADGRFHTNWLNMMYPRLRLARNLLKNNGIIFVSIDDHEVHNLRQMMNEIFGEENFVACLIWQKMDSPSRNDPERFVSEYHDYVLVFAKDKENSGLNKRANAAILEGYNITLPDGRMARRRQLRKNGKGARREDRPTLFYPLKAPDGSKVWPMAPEGWEGRWVLSEETWNERTAAGLTEWIERESGWVPYYLEVAPEDPSVPWSTLWTEVDQNRQAMAKFTALMGSDTNFSNPKPVDMIINMLRMSTSARNGDIVLDFFAGAGSTGHAVLECNKNDCGNRKFILVQIPDKTGSRKYPTIAEIGKERIRRAVKSLADKEKSKLKLDDCELDQGFKVFKLQPSNFKAWQDYEGQSADELVNLFTRFETPLVDGWQEEDVLTEILLLEGFPLDSIITVDQGFKRNRVFRVESEASGHRLYVSLDKRVADATIQAVSDLAEQDVFICFDSALTDTAKVQLADVGNVRTI